MHKRLSLVILLTASTLYGDTFLGGEVSLGLYNHSPSGSASYTLPFTHSSSVVDIEDDFGWSSEQDIVLKAYFEHPIPLFPNIKVAYNKISHTGQESVDDFCWGGLIDLDGELATSADMKMYDLTLYYELLDNWVEIDAGVTLRYLNGDIAVTMLAKSSSYSTTLSSEAINFEQVIPLLYGKTRLNIPNTDISLQLEGNAITYEDLTFYDYELSVRYTFIMGLGVEGGYKSIHLDSNGYLLRGLVIDMDLQGPYASIVWDF